MIFFWNSVTISLLKEIEQRKGATVTMRFDYSRLKGRIKMIFDTQERFATAMGISARTVSLKLNNAVDWTQREIILACNLLKIPYGAIPDYFFTVFAKFN